MCGPVRVCGVLRGSRGGVRITAGRASVVRYRSCAALAFIYRNFFSPLRYLFLVFVCKSYVSNSKL